MVKHYYRIAIISKAIYKRLSKIDKQPQIIEYFKLGDTQFYRVIADEETELNTDYYQIESECERSRYCPVCYVEDTIFHKLSAKSKYNYCSKHYQKYDTQFTLQRKRQYHRQKLLNQILEDTKDDKQNDYRK